MGEIPGIAGAAGVTIVGFVGHEKFGSVGSADDNRARRAEAVDDSCGARGNFVGAEKGARGVGPTSDVEAAFDRDGNAVARAEWSVAAELFGGEERYGASGVRIEVDEGV